MTRRIALIATLLAFAVPAVAHAAGPATATITGCKDDHMTVVGRIALTRTTARKARGATLQLRFRALALFGFPRAGNWTSLGKKTRVSGHQDFTGLAFNDWIGVMDWRYTKGRRTVLSGMARSQPARIGGVKGRADCTLAEGAKPVDTTPPQLFVIPVDDNWHHAPASIQVTAQDDFSGVKSVRYSVDDGPATQIPNGGTFAIATEGAHTVDISATDVAGNTATRTITFKVDAAPPTKPVLSKPSSVTANRTPVFQWSASTDSGSGMRGYVLVIRRQDGSVVAVQPVDANTTAATSSVTLDDNSTYTAVVTAVDNTADSAWTTDSDPLTFRVDTHAEVSSVSPADGSILSGSAKSGNFSLTLDRPADPSTVSPANVVLHNVDSGNDIQMSVGCAASPCTTITVDPQPSSLPEGRYTLTANNLKSDEGVAFASFAAKYSVPFVEGGSATATSGATCNVTPAMATITPPPSFSSNPSGDMGTLDFDWSSNGSAPWTLQAQIGGNPAGGNDTASSAGGAGGDHVHLGPFNLSSTLTFQLKVMCPSGTKVDISNAVGARLP